MFNYCPTLILNIIFKYAIFFKSINIFNGYISIFFTIFPTAVNNLTIIKSLFSLSMWLIKKIYTASICSICPNIFVFNFFSQTSTSQLFCATKINGIIKKTTVKHFINQILTNLIKLIDLQFIY